MKLFDRLRRRLRPRPMPYTLEWIRERADREWEDEDEENNRGSTSKVIREEME